ncbi:MAG: tetratricopeptide repeat protein, partial [Gammaproteobacteria bacterium]|nr:tetratricopeptide repeat protein [Gammaproteobacteria bacterium]
MTPPLVIVSASGDAVPYSSVLPSGTANEAAIDDAVVEEAVADSAVSAESVVDEAQAFDDQWSQLMAGENYADAVELAAARIKHLTNVDPDASEALYWPTLRYALALETLGQVDAAHRHFTQAIRISENHFGPFNPDLVEALTGHGRTLIAQGLYE